MGLESDAMDSYKGFVLYQGKHLHGFTQPMPCGRCYAPGTRLGPRDTAVCQEERGLMNNEHLLNLAGLSFVIH